MIHECHECNTVFRTTRKNSRYCTTTCFYTHQNKKRCNKCYSKDYRKGPVFKYKQQADYLPKARANRLRNEYGITTNQWQTMFERQEGLCPLCQCKLHDYGNAEGKRAAAVDHDHKTKRVRGLVCHVCNRSRIGKNTTETARRLLIYLESSFDGREI